jgi:glycerol-3-phosphate dehydrogenase
VIDTGKADPSKEGRDHALWLEHGLLTVTGGKLTTFRVIALDALRRVASLLPDWQADSRRAPCSMPCRRRCRMCRNCRPGWRISCRAAMAR